MDVDEVVEQNFHSAYVNGGCVVSTQGQRHFWRRAGQPISRRCGERSARKKNKEIPGITLCISNQMKFVINLVM